MSLPLMLASTSPYRRSLVERLGHPFKTEAPRVDEDAYKSRGLLPRELATTLAREKAREVSARFPGHLVIGGDQVAALGEHILGKPGSIEIAVAQILKLQAQTHHLFTALHLLGPGIDVPILEVTELTMRPLSFTEARAYILKDMPLDCAGSYKLEASGIKLMEKISGEDHQAIVGVPLMKLQTELLRLGFRLFDEAR